MKVELLSWSDNWSAVKNAAMNTIGSETGKTPTDAWKRKILMAEHSPIRLLTYTIRLHDIPYWVSVHLVRHKVGIEHWVQTQRTDRTGIDRNALPQGALVNHTICLNAQALINISRKRLCAQAAPETRRVWQAVVEAVREVDPVVASVCVPDCVYRGGCMEFRPCGFAQHPQFDLMRTAYTTGAAITIH